MKTRETKIQLKVLILIAPGASATAWCDETIFAVDFTETEENFQDADERARRLTDKIVKEGLWIEAEHLRIPAGRIYSVRVIGAVSGEFR